MLKKYYPSNLLLSSFGSRTRNMRSLGLLSGFLGVMLGLAACSHHMPDNASGSSSSNHAIKDGPPNWPRSIAKISNPEPKEEPLSKYGNPSMYEVLGKTYKVLPTSEGYQERGVASWYGTKFHGKRTSSGEIYDLYEMTAAHRTLPLPTYAKVKNLKNGKEVIVKITDRGPFVDDRLIDLSYAAAKKLGVFETGTAPVEIVAINTKTNLAAKDPAALTKPIKPTMASYNDVETFENDPLQFNESPKTGFPLFVQLGAFKDKNNAEKFAKLVNNVSTAHKINIHESKRNQTSWYKVRIGPLRSKEEVYKLKDQIIAANLPSPALTYE